jgi:porphobilinogen deaminase
MKLGTSSLRRKMQAKFHMNATNIEPLNGNIDTRLKKLNDGQYDCIILAEAGLSRLDFLIQNQNYKRLDHVTCSGQGVLAGPMEGRVMQLKASLSHLKYIKI